MTEQEYRIEKDSMGEVKVPANALYGAQTQRAVENFPISGLRMPRAFINALGLIKAAAANANMQLGHIDAPRSEAIEKAALTVAAGDHDEHFPIDVFQTGSGTSSNMNVNEVIARLATPLAGVEVHENDHVNCGQSSNDVIPTAIHVSAALSLENQFVPALTHLSNTIKRRAQELDTVAKTGRTHLMDAMPLRFGQELSGWAAQIDHSIQRVQATMPRLRNLALGGTAIGTGINADPAFSGKVAAWLAGRTGVDFRPSDNYFALMSSQDTAVEISGQLRTAAVALMKIANDLRWMNSGPLAGLGEISLPSLQPGSSIMPGKVNPVIPESVMMVCAHVMGNDTAVTVAGQHGNFQLNVMLPVIAYNVLQSIELLANAARVLADSAVAGFVVNKDRVNQALDRNPILVTALNPVIGYMKGAEIAKKAYKDGRAIREVARDMTDLAPAEIDRLLDPMSLTTGGIKK